MSDAVGWLYGLFGDKPADELRPFAPQPCYGDPLKARLFTIFNNPGADPRMGDENPAVLDECINDQKSHLRRLYSLTDSDEPLPWDSATPLLSGKPRYERLLYFGKDNTSALYLARLLNLPIFHADEIPYASKNSSAEYVDCIRWVNESRDGGDTLPSQRLLYHLAAAWLCEAVQTRNESAKLMVVRGGKRVIVPILNSIADEEMRKQAQMHIVVLSRGKYITVGTLKNVTAPGHVMHDLRREIETAVASAR